MKRDIEKILNEWKFDKNRCPLLVRGARQVGKTYTITEFGNTEFHELITINFELNPEYKDCFKTFEPENIIECISLLINKDIIEGKTLLFFDEIQECPEAIRSLRYFYEKKPGLHVIGAGSLLEFTLSQENFRMPVGRVQYLYMKPLSFLEFLDAVKENKLREFIENLKPDSTINDAIHNKLISIIKKYSIIGGMPAVVKEYIMTENLKKCIMRQTMIIQTFRDDFGKYANKTKFKYLQKLFYAAAKMIGKKFKYSHVDREIQSRELKNALELLEKSGIIYRVKKSRGGVSPTDFYSNERHFKVLFVDIGLMQNICGISEEILIENNLLNVYSGAVAEQFVGQELIAYQEYYKEPSIYYWEREAKGSSAEVDYIIQIGSKVFPIEVKAGKTGRLKSLHIYLEKYSIPFGIKVSQQQKLISKPVLSIPFYLIKNLEDYISYL
jgi:predicted AAA+ superfamily ATPase